MLKGTVAADIATGFVLVEHRIGNGIDQAGDELQLILDRAFGRIALGHIQQHADNGRALAKTGTDTKNFHIQFGTILAHAAECIVAAVTVALDAAVDFPAHHGLVALDGELARPHAAAQLLLAVAEQLGQPGIDEDEAVVLNDVHPDQGIAAQPQQQRPCLVQQPVQRRYGLVHDVG